MENIFYEIKEEVFTTSQGMNPYDYRTDTVDAIYLNIGDKKVLVDAVKKAEFESDLTWGESERRILPLNEQEVDKLLETDKREFLPKESLDDKILEFQKLAEQTNERPAGYKQLETEAAKLGKAIFNTLYFGEYRQKLITQANQRRESRNNSTLLRLRVPGGRN